MPSSNRRKGSHKTKKTAVPTDDGSDDEPLTKFIKQPQADDQHELSTSKEDGLNTSDDEPLVKKRTCPPDPVPAESSDDDEPLVKNTKKTASLPLKKRPVNRTRKNSNLNQIKDKHTDSSDSSDDEPLSKTVKNMKTHQRRKTSPSPARKSPRKVPNKPRTPPPSASRKSPRKPNQLLRGGEYWDSSDDEPLVRNPRSPVKRKRGRPRANNNNHIVEDEGQEKDSDEPLDQLVKKPRTPVKKTPAKSPVGSRKKARNGRKPKVTHHSSDDDDDEPLSKLVKKPLKREKKTKPTAKRSISKTFSRPVKDIGTNERSRRDIKPVLYTNKGSSNDSSDDEPLSELVKKPLKRGKKKMKRGKKSKPGRKTKRSPKKRSISKAFSRQIVNIGTSERSRRDIKPVLYTNKGSSNDGSDDEPLMMMMAREPLRILTVVLERIEDACEHFDWSNTRRNPVSGGKEENLGDELLVKITSPPEPLGERLAEEREKRDVNCDKEP